MKTNPFLSAVVLALLPFAPGAVGAETSGAPPPPAPAAVAAATDPAAAMQEPQPGQFIYSPRLPSPQELANVAAARGMTIERIEQTANQVTVVYRQTDGQTNVVGYVLLPSATAPGTSVVVTTPAPTVVYRAAPRVVYYDPYYYDRWYGWPPLSVSLGFGYGYYRGGYYYGGYRHGGHGFHGGGHHGRR